MVRIEKRGKGKGAEHEIAAKMAEEKREGKDRDWLRSSFIRRSGSNEKKESYLFARESVLCGPFLLSCSSRSSSSNTLWCRTECKKFLFSSFPFLSLVVSDSFSLLWYGVGPLLYFHGMAHTTLSKI